MGNHLDLAIQSYNETGIEAIPKPRPVESITPWLMRLLELLPADEDWGFVKAPAGGENSINLADGTLVRVARVMIPDGQIYKFQFDVPNGGPQWVHDDTRPELYHPYDGEHTDPGDPDPNPSVEARLQALEQRDVVINAKVDANHGRMEAINTRFDTDVNNLSANKVDKPLPNYYVKIFGINFDVHVKP